ncbi:MAG: hypothetical protein QXP25_01870 [Thermoplasmatales archaeon]
MRETKATLPDVLMKRPLLFTVIPLRDSKTGDKEHDEKILRNLEARKVEVAKAVQEVGRLNAISVPELVEENHEGKPRYNSVYTRALARGIADILNLDAVVNKVVAHIDTYQKFIDWIEETSFYGIRNMIFVGGNTRHHRYPGPSISEANVIARKFWEKKHNEPITIGNISLPERRDEAKRMLFKTITGAQFFTTQMLFDSSGIINLLNEYAKLCEIASVKPATVIFSFAPLRSTQDLNLLDFLGVDLPEEKKVDILEGRDVHAAARRSIYNSIKVFGEIMTEIERSGINVPVGVNVEQLTKSNLQSSVQMLKEFALVIDMTAQEIQAHSEMLRGD